jgi:hypothetical protein
MIIYLPKSGGGGFNAHHYHVDHKKTVALTSSSYSLTRTSNLFQEPCLLTICMVREKKKKNCLVWAPKKSFSLLNQRLISFKIYNQLLYRDIVQRYWETYPIVLYEVILWFNNNKNCSNSCGYNEWVTTSLRSMNVNEHSRSTTWNSMVMGRVLFLLYLQE